MAQTISDVGECTKRSSMLFQGSGCYTLTIFRLEIKTSVVSRERKLLELLGQPFIGSQIFKALQTMEEHRLLPQAIVKETLLKMFQERIIYCCGLIKVRDSKFFASQDYKIAVHMVSTKMYSLCKAIYKDYRA